VLSEDLVVHNVTAVDVNGVTTGAWLRVSDGRVAELGIGEGWPRSVGWRSTEVAGTSLPGSSTSTRTAGAATATRTD